MEAIRKAFERCAKALSLRPLVGRSTSVSRTRIRGGLVCEIEEGAWKLTADLPRALGGSASAPTPGAFSRAALGSGLAVGYMLHAAKLRVPIASLEVEVQADYDNGVLFGVSRKQPAYEEVRYTVTIESAAPEDQVRRVIDEGDAHSPYLKVFTDPQACRRTVRVVPVGAMSMRSRETLDARDQ
jgi:uncharacterized OsmC-like protein